MFGRPPFGIREVVGCCCLLVASPVLCAAPPWDAEPFTADPTAMVKAAAEIPFPEDAAVEVLIQQAFHRLDVDRRLTKRHHRLFRVATEEAARDWSLLEAEWSPWHEKRPVIKARVIHPDGTSFELDPATIAESAALQHDTAILHDRRLLQAPLPAMRARCLVEYEITWEETQPFFAAGAFERFVTVDYAAVRQARVTIEAPEALTLRHRFVGSDVPPTETLEDGWRKVVFDVGPQPEFSSVEPDQGPDAHPINYVAFSTGESWQAIAAAYAEVIESKTDPDSVRAMVEATLDGDESRLEAATKLLGITRELVRYTGLEFGASAIVPYTPEQTLTRRYGDCKDQATLLVSLLKAAGHDADVALLHVGLREDTLSDLPGLNAFNHAIVYVPGDPPLWMDPTSPYTAPGELPLAEQDRLALVANAATKDLVRTPRAAARQNIDSESMTLKMTTGDGTNVQQVITMGGAFAAEWRQGYAETQQAELQKHWTEYGRTSFQTERLALLEHSDPVDFSEPFAVKAEFEGAAWGIVELDAALIALEPGTVFDHLPWYLLYGQSQDDSDGVYYQPRRTRLHFPQPHVRECTYRVEPPPGYVLRELPDSETETFGSATFSQQYRRSGEAVIATYRFDTGDSSLSPDDVTRLRTRLSSLSGNLGPDGWQVMLAWDHQAYKLVAGGELTAGFARHQQLTSEHPQDSLYLASYAYGLLGAGLGTEARRVTAAGVEAMPENAGAHATLGLALMHDELGREMRTGFDRQGAIKAYRRAAELDPANTVYRWNLAVLLEHDRSGNRYADPEDLKAAAELYRDMLDEEAPSDPATNLGYCLYFAEEYEDLARLNQQYATIPVDLRLATTAVTKGIPAAKREADSLSPVFRERLQFQFATAILLDRGRHYQAAHEMYAAGLAGAANPLALRAAMDVLKRLKRFEDHAATADKPEYPVQQMLRRLLVFGLAREEFADLVVDSEETSEALLMLAELYRPARLQSLQTDSPVSRRLDALASLQYDVDGSDEVGYRVNVLLEGSTAATFFVLKAADGAGPPYRVLFAGPQNSALAAYSLQLLAGDRPAAARTWLDWASEGLDAGDGEEPYTGVPFARIWQEVSKDDPQALRVAAATLAAANADVPEVVATLESAVEAEQSAPRKLQLERALCRAYGARRQFDKLLERSTTLLSVPAPHEELHFYQLSALAEIGPREQLEAAVKQWLERDPEARFPVYVQARVEDDAGEFAQAYETIHRLLDQRDAFWLDYNTVAWKALYVEPLPEQALDYARQACEQSRYTSSACLHTLAMVLAETGHPIEARQALLQAIDARPLDRLESHDWLVLGRLSEHLGLAASARVLYQRVTEGDSQLLAQRRLKNLP